MKLFENYRKAKKRLFKLANTNKHGLKTGIINADDKSAEYFKHDIQTAVTYGINKGRFEGIENRINIKR